MTQIVVLTSHQAILPSLDYLHSQHLLKAVISPERFSPDVQQIAAFCADRKIAFVEIDETDVEGKLLNLFKSFQPDMVMMCGFPYRISQPVFSYPAQGFFNIHFSLLPAYRGADPIFWQIKNGESIGGITIHQVDEHIDTGAIVMQQQIPFIPGETWGICNGRYSFIVCEMLQQMLNVINADGHIKAIPVNGMPRSYFRKPVADDLVIKWDIQTADEIENLVNACNLSAGGALTFYKQEPIRLLEVSPVDATISEEVVPGTIVGADVNGVYVQCCDKKLLRINIISWSSGIISGARFAALGVITGECFERPPGKLTEIIDH